MHNLRIQFEPEGLEQISFNPKRNPERPWRVHVDHTFKAINKRNGVIEYQKTINAPLDTDLDSIPWFLRWAMPANGWHIRGCVFHDDDYKWQDVTRRFADNRLYMIMSEDRPKHTILKSIISFGQTWFVWFVLRATGWWAWRANASALAKKS